MNPLPSSGFHSDLTRKGLQLLLLLSFFSQASSAYGQGLKKIAFLPQWFPQAQFAGYYMASEKGIYQKHGLDVTILRGGPEAPVTDMLTRRKADITTLFLSTAIQRRAKGLRLVNIGQIVQRSGFMLVARKGKGISRPQDLDGKKVSLWADFQMQPLAFFRKYGLKVRVVPQTYTVNLFLRGGVDAASAMWYNEYHTILNSGLNEDEVTAFFFDRHGLNFPEDGIYCLEETVQKDQGLYARFLRASLEGWRYAFARPEETLDVVMRRAGEARSGTNRVHQKWMLARMKDIILPDGQDTRMGLLKEEEYRTVAGILRAGGLIHEIPDYREFHVHLLP